MVAGVLMLAACTSTGNGFDASSLSTLVVGQTTLEEASTLLKAEPTQVYRQRDGAATAVWSEHNSMVPDAVYFTRELWLLFDNQNRFVRIMKSTNVPQASQQR